MKSQLLLVLLLFILPALIQDIAKDKLTIYASLSYYKCDLDGDGLGDLAVWDPKNSTLYFQKTSDKKFYSKKFFNTNLRYEPVFADYDGDSITDFVFFQPDTGQWVLHLSTKPDTRKTFLGTIGDLPIPTDLNGSRSYQIGIWRPIGSFWLVNLEDKEGNKNLNLIREGSYQDSPTAPDYDGDRKSDLIVWRPDDGIWHIVKSGTNFDFQESEHIQHGQEWDIVIPNDYNGDGKADLVFYRPQDKTWYFLYTDNKGKNQIKFGGKDDIPLSQDLDKDNIPELITWNQKKKSWNILNLSKQETYSYKWSVPDGCIPANTILQKHE